jgi:hypothetical protein
MRIFYYKLIEISSKNAFEIFEIARYNIYGNNRYGGGNGDYVQYK